jgi:hypothetical protein
MRVIWRSLGRSAVNDMIDALIVVGVANLQDIERFQSTSLMCSVLHHAALVVQKHNGAVEVFRMM